MLFCKPSLQFNVVCYFYHVNLIFVNHIILVIFIIPFFPVFVIHVFIKIVRHHRIKDFWVGCATTIETFIDLIGNFSVNTSLEGLDVPPVML